MKRLILIVCLVGLSGCGALALSRVRLAQSSLGRLAPSAAMQGDVPAFTAGEQDFTFDLYRQLNGPPGNLLIAPHSLYLNLAMDYAGARNETQRQIASVLHAALPPERLHAAANALDQELAAAGSKDSAFQLAVASSQWAQQDFDFLPTYLDLLSQQYGAGVHLVDFKQEASRQQAGQAINQWASDQTHNKINDLLAPQALEQKTRLVLVNTVYFNAEWLQRFEPGMGPGQFALRDGTTVAVPFITSERFDAQGHRISDSGTYPLKYTSDQLAIVEVPYKGGRVSFVALMPKYTDQLADLEASLSAENLQRWLSAPAEQYQVFVEMPKFRFETNLELSDQLAALGMTDAFDAYTADFSGMDGRRDIIISTVAQKSTIQVNELGTEAASASYTGFIEISAPISIRLDHPFLFLILDRPSGAILFMGRMEDPR